MNSPDVPWINSMGRKAATVVAMAGGDPAEGPELDGVSLVPVLKGQGSLKRKEIVLYRSYENQYAATIDGKIASYCLSKKRGYSKVPIWLKQMPDNRGYLRVCLVTTKKQKVHQLVWLAFVGPFVKGMEIHHADLNNQNNHLDNLVLMTKKAHRQLHAALRKSQNNQVNP